MRFHNKVRMLVIFLKLLAFVLIVLVILNSQLNNVTYNIILKFYEKQKAVYNYSVSTFVNTSYPGVENYTLYQTSRFELLPLTNIKPLIPEFGPVINDVTSFNYPITIPPCGDMDSGKRSVFIAVISRLDNFEKRTKIRETWKPHIDLVLQKGMLGKIQFGFVLGQTKNKSIQNQIQEESKTYGDVIQVEMLDLYRNLPLKLTGLINWVNNNCPTVDFVVKVDDDLYVNVHVLVQFVKNYHQSGKMTIFGQSHRVDGSSNNRGPNRNVGPWQISLDVWPWNSYPNYITGSVYLMHGSSILPLLAAIQTTPTIHFEDVYLTGICSEKAGLRTQYSSGHITRNGIVRGWNFPGECDADKYLTWNNEELHHNEIDNFYRGSLLCKPNESVQFNFTTRHVTNDMSVIEIKL